MASFDSLLDNDGYSLAALPTRPQPPSSQGNLNRRSLSIFSRKGGDSPSKATDTLVTSSLFSTLGAASAARAPSSSRRPKRWRFGSNAQKQKVEGTILNRVPRDSPGPRNAMTPLERAMATCPNDEILRNIGLTDSENQQITSPSMVSPLAESFASRNTTGTSLAKKWSTRESRRHSQPAVLGIWANGEVHWNEPQPPEIEAVGDGNQPIQQGIERQSTAKSIRSLRSLRPNIRLVIPNTSTRPFSHISYFSRPAEGKDDNVSSNLTTQPGKFSASNGTMLHPPHPKRPAPYVPITISLADGSEESLAAALDRVAEAACHDQLLAPRLSCSDSSAASFSDIDESTSRRSSRSSLTSISSVDVDTTKELSHDLDQSLDAKHKEEEPEPLLVEIVAEPTVSVHNLSVATHDPPVELEGSSPTENVLKLNSIISLLRSSSTCSSIGGHTLRRSSTTDLQIPLREIALLQATENGSPTLSQAEQQLEQHLTAFPLAESNTEEESSLSRTSSISTKSTDAPAIPPRSARRVSKQYGIATTAAGRTHRVTKAPSLRKKNSVRFRIRTRPLSYIPEEGQQHVTRDQATAVLVQILENSENLDDLFNTALLNKSFYLVFKSQELPLMREVLRTMSSAGWEHRETCLPDQPDGSPDSDVQIPEYTAHSYYQSYLRDAEVIGALKSIILERCRSLLREATAAQLSKHNPMVASSVDDTLWRIWTFCRIFGCYKGREDDLLAQMDWLKGGELAHQDTCTSTISASDSFYLSGVLLGASEAFGRGNNQGLSAEQLYDITEMWNCLAFITSGMLERTELARQYGVFDNTDVRGGDIDGEEAMLEEWHAHILTLGLGPILDIAEQTSPSMASDPMHNASVFAFARNQGWTNWRPSRVPGSRSTFLRKAVSTLYEERVCEAFVAPVARQATIRELRQSHAASMPRIADTADRADGWERVPESASAYTATSMYLVNLERTRLSSDPAVSPIVDFRPTYGDVHRALSVMPTRRAPPPPSCMNSSTPSFPSQPKGTEQGSIPAMPTRPSPPPPAVARVPTGFPARAQHPSQSLYALSPANATSPALTADRAIFRIVEMGFTAEQAKGALRMTDRGGGLSIERAVEVLLRGELREVGAREGVVYG